MCRVMAGDPRAGGIWPDHHPEATPDAISHGPAHSPDPSKGYYPVERVLPLAWPSEVLWGITLEHGVFLTLWRQNSVRVKLFP